MQSSNRVQVVQIIPQSGPLLCAVTAVTALLRFVPASIHFPLFVTPKPCGLVIFTSLMLSSTQSKVLVSLNFNPALCGFHSFRRLSVSWAANHGVPLDELKAHGGWSSSALHVYLKNTPKTAASVPNTFKSQRST